MTLCTTIVTIYKFSAKLHQILLLNFQYNTRVPQNNTKVLSQNGCWRDRSRNLICMLTSKWSFQKEKKEVGHFEVRDLISNRRKNPKMAYFYFSKENSPFWVPRLDSVSILSWNQKYRFLIVWHALRYVTLRKMTSVKVLRFAWIYRINFKHIYGVIFWHI